MAGHASELNDHNFQQEVGKGVVLVDFYAVWCAPCRMIGPIVEKLADDMQGKMKVGKLNIDQAPTVTASLQIHSVPTLILFKDGQEVKRVVGVQNYDYLSNLVNSYL